MYGENKGFKDYLEQLIAKPNIAVVTEHPDITSKCEDISKAIMALYYIKREDLLKDENENIEKIFYQIV